VIVDERGPDRISVRSTAKLNLFLEVLGKRPDGYHEIETVMQEVALFDRLELERIPGESRGTIEFSCNVPGLAPPGANLVERAAALFAKEHPIPSGVRICLTKSTPAGTGMGAGSANAAATLAALNELFQTRIHNQALESLASNIGSDCAFFVIGGAAIARGRGEILEPIPLPQRWFLIAIPRISVPTGAVYAALAARLPEPSGIRTIPRAALASPSAALCANALFNRLEQAAYSLHPQLPRLADAIERSAATPVRLTGSGGALFAVFDDARSAQAAAERAFCDVSDPALDRFLVASSIHSHGGPMPIAASSAAPL